MIFAVTAYIGKDGDIRLLVGNINAISVTVNAHRTIFLMPAIQVD